MKKKLLTLLAMAAIGAALVTGCGGTEPTPEEPSVAESIVVDDASPIEFDEVLEHFFGGEMDEVTVKLING